MCRHVLLMVLWLLIGTRSCRLVVGLLSITEALCPFRMVLVTLCLMVWDWRISRAELMLFCWHDLVVLFCLVLFYLFLPSMGWLCGVGVFGLIECSHSRPALHSQLRIIMIIIIPEEKVATLSSEMGKITLKCNQLPITLHVKKM